MTTRTLVRGLSLAVFAVVVLLGLHVSARAQDQFPSLEGNPSHFRITSVDVEPETLPAGRTGAIVVRVSVDPEWHIYGLHDEGNPTKLIVAGAPEGLEFGAPLESPHAHEVEQFGMTQLFLDGDVEFRLPVTATAGAAVGPREIELMFEAMSCDELSCDLPAKHPLKLRLEVAPADAPFDGPDVAAPTGADAAGDGLAGEGNDSWIGLIGNGILFGLLTFLTPCVFPLVPVTVSFFSKQEGSALPRALVYAIGIVFTLTVIGLVTRSFIVDVAQGDWFNYAIGVLFVVLALSLFGLFDLRLPGFVIDASTKRSAAGGIIGAFFMAVTLALTSFSCSVPFVIAMFVTFDTGGAVQAIVGMLAYSVTVAFPFFLCALIPSLLKSMPRAGGWMNAVKVSMGFVELAMAFKFFRGAVLYQGNDWLPRSLVLAIWAACCFAAAAYLFGWFRLPKDTASDHVGVLRLLAALAFLSGGLYFVPGMFGRPLASDIEGFLLTKPEEIAAGPLGHGGPAAETGHLTWPRDDWDGAMARARENGRFVLFDFTGKT